MPWPIDSDAKSQIKLFIKNLKIGALALSPASNTVQAIEKELISKFEEKETLQTAQEIRTKLKALISLLPPQFELQFKPNTKHISATIEGINKWEAEEKAKQQKASEEQNKLEEQKKKAEDAIEQTRRKYAALDIFRFMFPQLSREATSPSAPSATTTEASFTETDPTSTWAKHVTNSLSNYVTSTAEIESIEKSRSIEELITLIDTIKNRIKNKLINGTGADSKLAIYSFVSFYHFLLTLARDKLSKEHLTESERKSIAALQKKTAEVAEEFNKLINSSIKRAEGIVALIKSLATTGYTIKDKEAVESRLTWLNEVRINLQNPLPEGVSLDPKAPPFASMCTQLTTVEQQLKNVLIDFADNQWKILEKNHLVDSTIRSQWS